MKTKTMMMPMATRWRKMMPKKKQMSKRTSKRMSRRRGRKILRTKRQSEPGIYAMLVRVSQMALISAKLS